MADDPATIRVRLRIVIYKDRLGKPTYFVDDYSELSPSAHAVWIEADVPVEPVPIRATVLA